MREEFNSRAALRVARNDNARGGYCAKGVANILDALGLPCQRGHAYTWKNTLPENGWIKIEGMRPEDAPEGAVLVFDRNARPGKKGGARYGHVEVVAIDGNGQRKYVSDAARSNWGGTVPHNFVGVYVHPDNFTPRQIRAFAAGEGLEASVTKVADSREAPERGGGLAGLFSRVTGGTEGGERDRAGSGFNLGTLGFMLVGVFAAAVMGLRNFSNESPRPSGYTPDTTFSPGR